MQRKCLKCGHINNSATGEELEACPQCGAIYSRVEAALAARSAAGAAPMSARPAPTPPPISSFAQRSQTKTEKELDVHEFAETMRSGSLYPTFRSLVKVFYWFWMLLAVVAAIGTLVTVFMGSGLGRIGGGLVGLFGTLFFILLARLTSETSLMLADLSDAAVRIAAKQEAHS